MPSDDLTPDEIHARFGFDPQALAPGCSVFVRDACELPEAAGQPGPFLLLAEYDGPPRDAVTSRPNFLATYGKHTKRFWVFAALPGTTLSGPATEPAELAKVDVPKWARARPRETEAEKPAPSRAEEPAAEAVVSEPDAG